jgi:pyridinium-3,5-bisthiocarboxylic acid mononucleotide nickel chelatase
MKIALIDCTNGVSADMILGAFLDAGVKLAELKKALWKVKIGRFAITARKQKVSSFQGVAVNVAYKKHDHAHVHYADIRVLITKSRLSANVKRRSLKIFDLIATAEARVHGVKKSKVTFHEVGAVDSLVDVIGVSWCFEQAKIKKAFAVNVSVGSGTIHHHGHGIMPVPTPATLEILKGVTLRQGKIKGELTTPTGAAIIKACCVINDPLLSFEVQKIGYGVGSRSYAGHRSVLRLALGETCTVFTRERIVVLEANIDDMNPQAYQGLSTRLFNAGALDVFTVPVMMKKERPAFMLVVLFPHQLKENISEVVFTETTTFGIRFSEIDRYVLDRRMTKIKTRFGTVRVKIGMLYGLDRIVSPEYEDMRKLAIKHDISFREIYCECQNAIKKTC